MHPIQQEVASRDNPTICSLATTLDDSNRQPCFSASLRIKRLPALQEARVVRNDAILFG